MEYCNVHVRVVRSISYIYKIHSDTTPPTVITISFASVKYNLFSINF